MSAKTNVVLGREYDRLTAVRFIRRPGKQLMVECRCRCKKVKTVASYSLTSGNTKSCGCLKDEVDRAAGSTTHGMTGTLTWLRWVNLRRRLKNNVRYILVPVCDRWKSFSNFLDDMGLCPSPSHTVDRKINSEGYCPENCRWATAGEQARNRSSNVWLDTGDGRILIAKDFAAEFGFSYNAVQYRARKGMTGPEIITQLRR